MALQNWAVPTKQQTHVQNQPLISHWSPFIICSVITNSSTARPSAQISLTMEDHTLIDGEVHRQKRNNTCLCQQEEDHQLIADGEGQIIPSSQQYDTNFMYFTLPPFFQRTFTGPSQFRWTQLNSPSDFQQILLDLTKFRCLSGPSPVKVQWNRKASDWPDWPVRWMSVGLPTVLEAENRQNVLSVKSDGLPMDFQGT